MKNVGNGLFRRDVWHTESAINVLVPLVWYSECGLLTQETHTSENNMSYIEVFWWAKKKNAFCKLKFQHNQNKKCRSRSSLVSITFRSLMLAVFGDAEKSWCLCGIVLVEIEKMAPWAFALKDLFFVPKWDCDRHFALKLEAKPQRWQFDRNWVYLHSAKNTCNITTPASFLFVINFFLNSIGKANRTCKSPMQNSAE